MISDVTYNWSTGESTESIIAATAGNYCVTVTDCSGCEVVTCTDIEQCPLGTISGTVKEDIDNNDLGEDVMSNIEIKLLYDNGNPVLDDENNPITQFTDAFGYYEFLDVTAGDYILMEVQPVSYFSVYEKDNSSDDDTDIGDESLNDDMIPVNLTPGELDSDNDFVEELRGEVSGYFYKQVITINDDGDETIVFVPQAGKSITLLDDGDIVITTNTTNESGFYSFPDLDLGVYSVESEPAGLDCEDVNDEDNSTSPSDPEGGDDPIDNRIPVELTYAEFDSDNNFVDASLINVGNYVFYDENGNGEQDAAELGVENVDVYLYSAGPDATFYTEDDVEIDMQTTDDNGLYLFSNVYSNSYYVFFDPATLPVNYIFTSQNTGSTDNNDSDVSADGFDEVFTLSPGELDDLSHDAGIVIDDPCQDWIMGEANTVLSVGVIASPDVVGSAGDIVNHTFILYNAGVEALSNVVLEPNISLLAGGDYEATLDPIFAGDPNGNDQLDPGEVWFFTAVNTYSYSQGDVYIISAGTMADAPCGLEIGAGADLLFTSGVNMEVDIVEDAVNSGDEITVNLITRLLIEEDAAKDPGVTIIIIGDLEIEVPLPASQWEARDLMITATGLNDGLEFDPFTAGIPGLINFSEQGDVDDGRNTNNVLDECEPINTFRDPCTFLGEDDILCDFPDWVFTYTITIPEDFEGEYEVTALDVFTYWKADENPAGSGNFGEFVDITGDIVPEGEDTDVVTVTLGGSAPVDLVKFEATKKDATSLLIWETSSEINNSHFRVEKSTDSYWFDVIGIVEGAGNSTELQRYNFIDRDPAIGANYYRLVQVDYDGTYAVSQVEIVEFDYLSGTADIRIYPNPTADILFVETASVSGKLTLELFDVFGKKIRTEVVSSGESIDVSNIPSGGYIVNIYDASRYKILSEHITISRL